MKKPKIYACVSMNSFPLWRQTMRELKCIVDGVAIRFDMNSGDPGILKELEAFWGDKLKSVGCADKGWAVPEWREEMISLIHALPAADKPDIVLVPDEDEVFDVGIVDELINFWHSDKDAMMFDYHPLESHDGRQINGGVPYPPDPHMKAFKYKKGLSYFPYHGDAKLAQYSNSEKWFLAKTKIRHFPAFTPAMQAAKHWRSDTPKGKGVKAVTLLGFGPSSQGKLNIQGEVWGLNNMSDVYSNDIMKRVTRVFDMHHLEERVGKKWDDIRDYLKLDKLNVVGDRRSMRNGKTHIENLDAMGKKGTRIILQEAHPHITNSEAYPINEVLARLGLDWFTGTPCYMVALAIMEGYTHINVYGADQLDHEHTVQKECFAGWMSYAVGRGIQIGGVLTWLEPYKGKRYGYDYGPEHSPFHEEMMFRGHPFTLKYKTPSRAELGDMYRPGGK